MAYQDLLNRHSMIVFCRQIIEIDQRYPLEEHKARMLPLLEEFKGKFNAAIRTENDEFALLIKSCEDYLSKLMDAQTKCSACDNLRKLIERKRGDQRYAQAIVEWETEWATNKERLIEILNELNRIYHNIYAYSIAFSKKATSGIVY